MSSKHGEPNALQSAAEQAPDDIAQQQIRRKEVLDGNGCEIFFVDAPLLSSVKVKPYEGKAREIPAAAAPDITAAQDILVAPDINSAALVIKTAPPDINSAALVIKTAPPDINSAALVIKTAPPDINSAALVIKTAPPDINSAALVINTAPPDINSAALVINTAPPDINSAALRINTAPLDNSAVENNSGSFVERLPASEGSHKDSDSVSEKKKHHVEDGAAGEGSHKDTGRVSEKRKSQDLQDGAARKKGRTKLPLKCIARELLPHCVGFVSLLVFIAVMLPRVTGGEVFKDCSQHGLCPKGHYQADNETCKPCPTGMFMAWENNSCHNCTTCSTAEPKKNQKVITKCTSTSNAVIGCMDGFEYRNRTHDDPHGNSDPPCKDKKAEVTTVPETTSGPGSVTPGFSMIPTTNSSWHNETAIADTGSNLWYLLFLLFGIPPIFGFIIYWKRKSNKHGYKLPEPSNSLKPVKVDPLLSPK